MLDAPIPYHSLTMLPTGPSEGSQSKCYQQESLVASSDPDVIKIHLQSSLCLHLTPAINLMINFSHHQKRMGSRLLKKVTSPNHQFYTRNSKPKNGRAHNLLVRSTIFQIQSYYWTQRIPKNLQS